MREHRIFCYAHATYQQCRIHFTNNGLIVFAPIDLGHEHLWRNTEFDGLPVVMLRDFLRYMLPTSDDTAFPGGYVGGAFRLVRYAARTTRYRLFAEAIGRSLAGRFLPALGFSISPPAKVRSSSLTQN